MFKQIMLAITLLIVIAFLVYLFSYHGLQAGFTAVIALTTIVYTWVTYGLLTGTKSASEAAERAYTANAILEFTANMRELSFYLLNNPAVTKAVYAQRLDDKPEQPALIYGNAWWLHTARFFRLLKFKMLPEEDWDSLRYGIVTLLSLPAMKSVWDQIKDGYDKEFRNFVDEEHKKLENERLTGGGKNEL